MFGTLYYRLAQYDYDGEVNYSHVLSLHREDPLLLNLTPNPFASGATLQVISPSQRVFSIQITDLRGMVVYRNEGNQTNREIGIGKTLTSGIYILQVIIDNSVYTHKIIKE
ncbi:MAG: T9SS type A sorting domain-containing protein [Cytophagaceae bacterium]